MLTSWALCVRRWEGHVISVVSCARCPKAFWSWENTSKLRLRAVSQNTGVKVSKSWKAREELRAVTNWRRLKRNYKKVAELIEFPNIPHPASSDVNLLQTYSAVYQNQEMNIFIKLFNYILVKTVVTFERFSFSFPGFYSRSYITFSCVFENIIIARWIWSDFVFKSLMDY